MPFALTATSIVQYVQRHWSLPPSPPNSLLPPPSWPLYSMVQQLGNAIACCMFSVLMQGPWWIVAAEPAATHSLCLPVT